METLFIGSTRRGFLALQALHKIGAEISGIISLDQFAHESERYEQNFKSWAEAHQVPFFQVKTPRGEDLIKAIREKLRPQIIFVVGCRQMLPPEIFEFPKLGTYALHDSLLPHYRGFAPLNWAIANGEQETGVSLFRLTHAVDAGEVVGQKSIPITPTESADQVYEKVCQATVNLITENYSRICDGSAQPQPQATERASYTCARSPEDGLIDWNGKTKSIFDQVRALARPFPGAFTHLGTKKLIIWKASVPEVSPHYVGRIPGRVVGIHASGSIDVLTGDGILTVEEVQLEGQAPSPAAQILKSVRTTLGLNLSELLLRISELERQLARRA